jgi:type IVB pilus formation R64 PilN family outer membrane protein
MKKIVAPGFSLLLPLALLSGCGGYHVVNRDVTDRYEATRKDAEEAQARVMQGKLDSPLIRQAKTVWIGSQAVPFERGSSLPPQFDELTLNFSGRHNIGSVAEILQRATGLRIMVHPDVLVSMRELAQTEGGSSTMNGQAVVTSVGSAFTPGSVATLTGPRAAERPAQGPSFGRLAPERSGDMALPSGQAAADYFVDVPLSYRGSLASFLDSMTSRLGLGWEYRDGAIEIRRFITRSYSISALPGSTTYRSSLGKNGGIDAGATGGANSSSTGSFSSEMRVAMESNVDYWASLEGTLKAMLSAKGRLAVNQGTGTVTVTDIRDVVDRVTRYLEEENRIMTRQIAFEVKLFAVQAEDGSEFGVNWDVVYSKLTNLLPDVTIGLQSPATIVGPGAGSIGVSVVRDPLTGNGGINTLSGSSALVQALASVSKVSLVTSQRAVTLNRQVVPVAVTEQVAYVAETSAQTSGTGSSQTTTLGLKAATVTTGFILNLMPSVTERNGMVLTVGLDLSELRSLEPFRVGSGPNEQKVQQPVVASTQFIQRVALRTGETLVLSGFERVNSNSRQRTLDTGVSPGLGGSFSGRTRKESLVFMITPVMVEGL